MKNKQKGGYYNYISLINPKKKLQIETKYTLVKIYFFPQFFIVKNIIIKKDYSLLVLFEENGDNMLVIFIKDTDTSLITILKLFYYVNKKASSEIIDIDDLDNCNQIYCKDDFTKLRIDQLCRLETVNDPSLFYKTQITTSGQKIDDVYIRIPRYNSLENFTDFIMYLDDAAYKLHIEPLL